MTETIPMEYRQIFLCSKEAGGLLKYDQLIYHNLIENLLCIIDILKWILDHPILYA